MNSTLASFHSTVLRFGRSWNLVTPDEPTPARAECRRPGRPTPHELDAAARDDEGLEAVRAQIAEQLDHRLVDQVGVGPVEPRVPGGPIQSLTDLVKSSVVMSLWVAAMIVSSSFSPAAASALWSPSSSALNGCLRFQSGRFDAIALARSIAKANWK